MQHREAVPERQRDALTGVSATINFFDLTRRARTPDARVVELVDTQVSEACAFTGVGVQVPPRA